MRFFRRRATARVAGIAAVPAVLAIAAAFDWPPNSIRPDLDPPGALRGRRYTGILRSASGGPAFAGQDTILVWAFRPEALRDLRITSRTDTTLRIECAVDTSAAETEAIFIRCVDGERIQEASVLLATVASTWDPDWRPTAVAPADTAVADSTCSIVLDASRSHHPAGRNAMHFRWVLGDGSTVIKGGVATSTTLPPGTHTFVLIATDEFGHSSVDTMHVRVGDER